MYRVFYEDHNKPLKYWSSNVISLVFPFPFSHSLWFFWLNTDTENRCGEVGEDEVVQEIEAEEGNSGSMDAVHLHITTQRSMWVFDGCHRLNTSQTYDFFKRTFCLLWLYILMICNIQECGILSRTVIFKTPLYKVLFIFARAHLIKTQQNPTWRLHFCK